MQKGESVEDGESEDSEMKSKGPVKKITVELVTNSDRNRKRRGKKGR